MKSERLSRRDFNTLAAAALGGIVTGVGSVYADDKGDKDKDKHPLLKEPHTCRGLNTCKEKGSDKKNSCAGQGACATAKAHECKGMNECKGQGGCGEKAGTETPRMR